MRYSKEFTKSLISLIESQIADLERDKAEVTHSITERAIEKEVDKLKGDVEFLKNESGGE